LLSGQTVIVNATSSAGLLIGGPVIAALGAEHTLVWAGLLTGAVAFGVLAVSRRRASGGPAGARRTGAALGERNRETGESAPCETAGHVRDRDHDPCRAA
jgi:hypothetical protein